MLDAIVPLVIVHDTHHIHIQVLSDMTQKKLPLSPLILLKLYNDLMLDAIVHLVINTRRFFAL